MAAAAAAAAQKHLHELLKEDQEPFLLTNYISEKRNNLLKRPSTNTILQFKKQKPPPPTTTTTTTIVNLCKNACFSSFQNTPDIKNSPLFEFSSPTKTPSSNAIFLQIPTKTASLLLEAALKIQNNKKTHYQNKNKNKSFGVFGSLLKKLTQRNSNKKNESSSIEGNDNNVSVKDILRWDSSIGKRNIKCYNEIRVCSCEVGFTCSSCNGRHSNSAVWSESNEDKSMDMETSSSGNSCDSVEEFVMNKKKQNADCDHNGFFCESPFHFVLERSASSSSGHRTPEFSSPPDSPSRHQTEDKENNGVDGVNKFQSGEDEEEKEQCSPVSVLDPPFQDYDDDDDDCHENDDEEGDFDLECSYANVQRTKQHLLDRLRRFEQLAELDPLELEKRMQEDNEHETFFEDDDDEDDESDAPCEEKALREIVNEILCHSSVHDRWQDQEVLKRLVCDLIKEEEKELNCSQDMNNVMKRVCKKMELWKEVESNTIDMMIEEDFTREEIGWKKNNVETKELAGEVELAIFCFLVDEFSEELVC